MTIDVNDPATWPEDLAELAKLAGTNFEEPEHFEAMPAEGTPEGEEGKTEPPRDDKGRFAKPETPAESPPPAVETPTPAPAVETPTPAPDNAALLQRAFDAMQAERDRAAALEAQLVAARTPPATPEPPKPEFSDEVLVKAERMKKDWGQDVADLYLDSVRSNQRAERAERLAEDLRKQAEARQQRDQAAEDARIQSAIVATPLMAAWQADAQSPYFKRAVALHQQLMENDPVYAAQPWSERFAALPTKVEAVYGVSPHAAKLAPKAPEKPPEPFVAPKVPEKPAEQPPLSLSDLPAGMAPVADKAVEVGRMSGPQIQQHVTRLAANPDALRAFLAQIH